MRIVTSVGQVQTSRQPKLLTIYARAYLSMHLTGRFGRNEHCHLRKPDQLTVAPIKAREDVYLNHLSAAW